MQKKFQDLIVIEMMGWIIDHIHDDITLDMISKYTGYSKCQAQRLFFEKYGVNIITHVRKRRILNSALDIFLSSEKITEISVKYHYSSSSSFTRAFNQCFDCPPACFRNYEIMGGFISKISTDLIQKNSLEREKIKKQKVR